MSNTAQGGSIPVDDYDFQGTIRRNAQYSTPDWPKQVAAPKNAPNIVLIMTDDVGFGASSTFGGPIQTPTFTKIAERGVKYNRFHTTALCSPTRASLITGRLPHNVANGSITEWAGGYPGYTTLIPKSCASVGRILQCNGFNTAWFGKNHNVPLWETSSAGPFDHWPNGLGFDHFYGFVGADTDQYHPVVYTNTTPTDPDLDNKDYHFDNDIADKAIQYVKDHHALTPDKPFFMYYVPGATHAPHHVPQEWIDIYEGQFDQGWTKLREETLERMKEMGIVPENTKDTERPPGLQKWDITDEGEGWAVPPDRKKYFSKMAETYAGYLSFTDHNIGRVVDAVEELGQDVYDNTLFIYIMGDNGGSAEGTVRGTTNEISTVANYLPEPFSRIETAIDRGEFGSQMHYNHIPAVWAWAFNAPMQWAKRYASHFGGTRNAMAMSWGNRITPDDTPRHQFHHIVDILPTILDACGLPESYKTIDGFDQTKFDGVSMAYTWPKEGRLLPGKHKEIVFEMFGNRGLFSHEMMWSTTPLVYTWDYSSEEKEYTDKDFSVELYDLAGDFSQGTDLLKDKKNPNYGRYKTIADSMESRWNTLAAKNNIFPLSFTDAERVKANSDMPLVTEGRTSFTYPEGIIRVPEFCAPSICNVNSTIKAVVTMPHDHTDLTKCEGCIVKLGGRFGGWGIIVQKGIPKWVYKSSQWPKDIVYDRCGTHLQPGENIIQIECIYEGADKGTDQLGNPMEFKYTHMVMEGQGSKHKHIFHGSGSILRSVPARFGVTETFDVGQNCGSPLHDSFKDQLPFKFTGKIDHVQIDVDTEKQSDTLLKRMFEARKKFYVNVD